jgi:hypothetical protein
VSGALNLQKWTKRVVVAGLRHLTGLHVGEPASLSHTDYGARMQTMSHTNVYETPISFSGCRPHDSRNEYET